jgi:hypothetical protein
VHKVKRYTSVLKVAFAFLWQAFVSVVLDTQRKEKIRNFKIEGLFSYSFWLRIVLMSVAYLPPIFSSKGSVSFRLTLYIHLAVFLLF